MVRLVLAVASVTFLACSLPTGDQSAPTQAHYKWIGVRQAGDVEGMWLLLDPAVKQELERWLTAEKVAIHDIRSAYPKQDADAAIAALGGGKRADISDAKGLFALIVRANAEGLGTMQELGARVRSENISEDGRRATIRTYGGDELQFVKGDDGQWYATLQPDERQRLHNARLRAEQNLDRVRANLKKLSGKGR
jgi:hypothetical protein